MSKLSLLRSKTAFAVLGLATLGFTGSSFAQTEAPTLSELGTTAQDTMFTTIGTVLPFVLTIAGALGFLVFLKRSIWKGGRGG